MSQEIWARKRDQGERSQWKRFIGRENRCKERERGFEKKKAMRLEMGMKNCGGTCRDNRT